jgi:hypothetical protein
MLPFPMPEWRQWETLDNIHTAGGAGSDARLQLRGSGGFSPRFPNIPLRDKVELSGQLVVRWLQSQRSSNALLECRGLVTCSLS